MSVGATSGSRGHFGVVGRPQLGTVKERTLVEDGDLDEKTRGALEADTFIIYGKASVEQYDEDDPPQKIEMKAFEDVMDEYLDGGIISRRHKDIPVGEPLESYELEEPTEVVVGDEVLEFGRGDELQTGVKDDELWIVADLRNDSEIARETRLGAMTGDLTGFSVTVFCKEWEETHKGQRVTSVDWHSTTIGGDEHIKNKDSRFGVAEFKALFGDKFPGLSGKQAERATVEILHELPANMSAEGDTDEKSFWEKVSDIASQKADAEADSDGDPETEKAGEEQTDEKGDTGGVDEGAAVNGPDEPESYPEEQKEGEDIPPEMEEEDLDEEDDAFKSDVGAVLEQVKQEIGDEQAEVLEDAMMMEDEDEDEPNSEAEEGELKASDVAEAMKSAGFVTKDQLEEKLDSHEPDTGSLEEKLNDRLPEGEVATKEDVEEVMKAAEEVLTDVLPEAQKSAAEDAAEQTAEKMVTGETPDPSGGSAQDEQDYMDEIQSRFASTNGGN